MTATTFPKTIVADASAILKTYLRDETDVQSVDAMLDDLWRGRLKIVAPSLLRYEISNALWAAARQGRISIEEALAAQTDFLKINIDYMEPDNLFADALNIAFQHNRSVYDSAYVALAQKMGVWFFTGDRRLYNVLSPRLSLMRWVGDYNYEEIPR